MINSSNHTEAVAKVTKIKKNAQQKTNHVTMQQIGHFANKCRSSPSVFQGSQVQRLQRKPFTK